jgi:hypothetical protein
MRRTRRKSPIRTLAEGILAGAIGAGVQTLFFRATARIAPKPPKDAFVPPDREQAGETELETTARRFVEGMARRGPLDERTKKRLGALVHYGIGARWGVLFNLLRGRFPRLWSVPGVAGFSATVWIVDDNVLLPAFKLAAWPQHYPLRSHAYAIAAHLVYGAGVAGALLAADHGELVPVVAALALARGRSAGERAIERTRAIVPRDVIEGPRHLAAAIARRARDLNNN